MIHGDTMYMSSLYSSFLLPLFSFKAEACNMSSLLVTLPSVRIPAVQTVSQKYWMPALNVELLNKIKSCSALLSGWVFPPRGGELGVRERRI